MIFFYGAHSPSTVQVRRASHTEPGSWFLAVFSVVPVPVCVFLMSNTSSTFHFLSTTVLVKKGVSPITKKEQLLSRGLQVHTS